MELQVRLAAVLAAAVVLIASVAGCSGGDATADTAVVRSADGVVAIVIPDGALPAGVTADELSVSPVGAHQVLSVPVSEEGREPIGGAPSTVHLQPKDVVAAFRLEPAGLAFAEPVHVRLRLPAGTEGALLALLSSPERDDDPLAVLPFVRAANEALPEPVEATLEREVAVAVPHFSVLSVIQLPVEPFNALLTPMRVTRELGEEVEFTASFGRAPALTFVGNTASGIAFSLELEDQWSIQDGWVVSTDHQLHPTTASLAFTEPLARGIGPYEGRARMQCINEGRWFPVQLEGSVAVGGLLTLARPDKLPFTSAIGPAPFAIEIPVAARVECVRERDGWDDDDGGPSPGQSELLNLVGGGQWVKFTPTETLEELLERFEATDREQQEQELDELLDRLEHLSDDDDPAFHPLHGEKPAAEPLPEAEIRGLRTGLVPGTFFNPAGLHIRGSGCGTVSPSAPIRMFCPVGASSTLGADPLLAIAVELDAAVPDVPVGYTSYVLAFDLDGDLANGYVPPEEVSSELQRGADTYYELAHFPESGWQFARWGKSLMSEPTTSRVLVGDDWILFVIDPAEVAAGDGSITFRSGAQAYPGAYLSAGGAADTLPSAMPDISGTPPLPFAQMHPYTVGCGPSGAEPWAEGVAEVRTNGDLYDQQVEALVGRNGAVDSALACAAHGH